MAALYPALSPAVTPGLTPLLGANGTWVTLYYQDMGYSLCCRAVGFLVPGNV